MPKVNGGMTARSSDQQGPRRGTSNEKRGRRAIVGTQKKNRRSWSTGRTIEEVCPRRASSRSLLRETLIGLGPLPPLLEALAVFTVARFGKRFFASDLLKQMVVLTTRTMHARDAGPWRAQAQEFQSA